MSGLTEAIVVEAVNEVLGAKRREFEPIEASTPLAELRLDSLDVAELFMAIEDHAGIEIDPEPVRAMETVGDLVRLRPLARDDDHDRGTTG